MKWTKEKIKNIKLNKDNPRIIKDENFKRLVKSIQEFPQMLDIRPIVVNRDMIVIGGNQRLKACIEAGFKEVPIVYADSLTPEQEKQFIIKDNISEGEWDFDLLEGWEVEELKEWGIDFQIEEDEKELYSRKLIAPHYEVTGIKPELSELYDDSKMSVLLEKIEGSNLDESMKNFLRIAVGRFAVLNFEKIAEYYAHESKEVQELFEDLALVVVDFESAIKNGFVELAKSISDQYFQDHEE